MITKNLQSKRKALLQNYLYKKNTESETLKQLIATESPELKTGGRGVRFAKRRNLPVFVVCSNNGVELLEALTRLRRKSALLFITLNKIFIILAILRPQLRKNIPVMARRWRHCDLNVESKVLHHYANRQLHAKTFRPFRQLNNLSNNYEKFGHPGIRLRKMKLRNL